MGSAIDLFVTYRFLRLLTTPFEKTDAYKFGIIDKNGNRIKKKLSSKPEVELTTSELKNSYTILHKLVFNIKKIFAKVPGLRTKVGTYAAALFLLKDTFKESVDDPDMFEKEFIKYLKENDIELDNEISEEVIGFGEVLPKGEYVLAQDILNKEEEELSAKKGDKVIAFADEAPVDTILGIDIFPVVHVKTQEKIYISLEDIKDDS
ncbi:MAG: hypothetical protein CBE47_01260 [Pelagibacteraceae bacterium TMED287]|nr:MAG: hypothetical protein CBE47_01260 [Pelagibacteraceae bacterium TMED287]